MDRRHPLPPSPSRSLASRSLALPPSRNVLSYRHLFHAGNFADVFKHALLARLLIALGGKGKPYCYLDTHAGTGRYDLGHEWAWKTREFENGIGRLWPRKDIPAELAPYLDAVRSENPKGRLRYYPGSPLIALKLRRPGDRIVLSELNRTDCAELEAVVGRERHVAVHLMDGYQALKAFLPPPERRGLVLLDSSFDRVGRVRAHRASAEGRAPALGHGDVRGLVSADGAGRDARFRSRHGKNRHRQDSPARAAGAEAGCRHRDTGLRNAGGQPAVEIRSRGAAPSPVALAGADARRSGRRESRLAGAGTATGGQAAAPFSVQFLIMVWDCQPERPDD